jgi:uncharacterized protein
MASVSWVLKLTKLCNLRCSYCYEWNELADARKMTLETFERATIAVRTFERHVRGLGVPLKSNIILHGGEPFLAGRDYFAEIRRIAKANLRDTAFGIQTNGYALQDWHLQEIKAFPLGVGVSFDAYAGVRRTAAGRETDERVFDNLMTLIEAGVEAGVISVLGAHTVENVHDLLMIMHTIGAPIRLLPIFGGPPERPDGFHTSDARLIDALTEAALLRLEGRIAVSVSPVDAYIRIAIATLLGIETPRFERGVNTGGVFNVERDGRILLDHAPHEPPLGHLMQDDVASPAFAARLLEAARAFENERTARICRGCPFAASCDGYAAIVNGPAPSGIGCRFARPVMERILAVLDTPEQRARLERILAEVAFGEAEATPAPSYLLAV